MIQARDRKVAGSQQFVYYPHILHNKHVAVYKVPQDVEAEDKLIGPLSFRQFIYMMVAAGAAFVAFLLFQLSPFLVLIPIPVILLFGALALPLRKDQPMETYFLAIIRFMLKPRQRVWDPDGTINYVEITAPKTNEPHLTKSFSQEAAEERLDYLARVMDSRGWALKGVEKADVSLSPGVVDEAAMAFDIMDDHADLAKSFDDLIAKKNEEHRQAAISSMQNPPQQQPAPQTQQPTDPGAQFAKNPYRDLLRQQFHPTPGDPTLHYNPYPSNIRQKVIQPSDATHRVAQPTTPQPKKPENKPTAPMTATVSPDIMRLASNNDLSISAIAREAHRLQDGDEGEVVITLH